MRDRIHLFDVALECRIGVTAEERGTPQQLLADVAVETDIRAAAAGDDIGAAIDYAALLETMRELAAEREYALIETLAERMAGRILERFPAEGVRILLKKPAALRERGVGAPAVEIERVRHG